MPKARSIDYAEIAREYELGKDAQEIAKQFGMSVRLIHYALRTQGVLLRPHRGKIDPARLTELRSFGATEADLSFIFQVSPSAIRQRLAQLGLSGAA